MMDVACTVTSWPDVVRAAVVMFGVVAVTWVVWR